MIECIFTIDYEIYGDGQGSLRDLIYDPAEKLKAVFEKEKARFVLFVEVAELEVIEAAGTDPAIGRVRQQIRDFHRDGFEIGLHLHPQWYNARRKNGRWELDYSEYNLCTLPRDRIVQIIDRAIAYLRDVLGAADFTPLSFRAGNWLFKPTQPAAEVLAARGIKVDSSVFKGGVRHQYQLDYRRALRNGDYWFFSDQVDLPDPEGALLEFPIHTRMVPFWKMIKPKRINSRHIGIGTAQSGRETLCRLVDFLRYRHPLKLDFCCMTLSELTQMVDAAIEEDRWKPSTCKPIVAIGHTKELADFDTIGHLLSYLRRRGVSISTFQNIYQECR
jgi:hypothetical protein